MNDKWQRIRFMPAIPLYPDSMRITGSQEHCLLSREAAREGMVLLKNEGCVLPLSNTRLAVFGKAQIDYVKGGGGSGDTTVAYVKNIVDGLSEKEQTHNIEVFSPLTDFYGESVKRQFEEGKTPGTTVEPEIPSQLLKDARAFTDTAIITICRFSGEGFDRTGEAFDGDYFLSHEESEMVEQVKSCFERVVVVLNVGGTMDTGWFKNDSRIHAVLFAGQAGLEGGRAIADILVGDYCPSGHLADTFVDGFDAYPSSEKFNLSDTYVEYEEDIYVGYRYFETIPEARKKVLFPFGFGLSYTKFTITDTYMSHDGDDFALTAKVTNKGEYAGRYVLQLYASAPQGILGKPARVLVGFVKTKELTPNESETVKITFSTYQFASYDDTGKIEKSAYVLEAGNYSFYCGDNVRDAELVDYVYRVSDTIVVSKLSEKCSPVGITRRLCADGTYEPVVCKGPVPERTETEYPAPWVDPVEWVEPKEEGTEPPEKKAQLIDVVTGKLTLDEFIEQMSVAQMVHVLSGQPNRGVASTYGLGNLPKLGIPNVMTTDGPAGLRISPSRGVTTTAFPCASQLACSWDVNLTERIGYACAEEVYENGFGVWLSPAVNIHRSPLCGRNFEYFSEDPLLAGKMAAGMIRGTQKMNIASSLKHFCCNNKETNRHESDSRLTERALREIYLKPFEICIKEANPWTVMSSYNLINGQRTSQCKDLLSGILREEWGFDGLVLTDWRTHSEQWKEIKAGNDIKMPCGMDEHTLKMISEGLLDVTDVKNSVKRLLSLIIRLP